VRDERQTNLGYAQKVMAAQAKKTRTKKYHEEKLKVADKRL
jgi:hypothetical protein